MVDAVRRMSGEMITLIVVTGVLLGTTFWISLPLLTGGEEDRAAVLHPAPAADASPAPDAGRAAGPRGEATDRAGARDSGDGLAGGDAPDGEATHSGSASAEGGASIADPRELADSLARIRYAYVTGRAESSAAVPGSPAADEDDRARAHYSGSQVDGGEPVIDAAQLESFDRRAGSAELTVTLSIPAHRITTSAGTADVPASGPSTVRLHLTWADGSWLVEKSEPVAQ